MTSCFEREMVIRHDPRIAQLLSPRQQQDPKISPATRGQVTISEDRDAFRLRITAHVEEMRHQPGPLIWVITHQGVIEEIAEHFGVKISGDLDFLDFVVMLK